MVFRARLPAAARLHCQELAEDSGVHDGVGHQAEVDPENFFKTKRRNRETSR